MHSDRRDFLRTSAVVAAGVALGRPRAGTAQPAGTGPMVPTQPQAQPVFTPIRRNVGTFTMRGGTVGWLVSGRAVAVVDTQFPAEARALLDGLRSRSGSPNVDVVLNTHHHGDHTAGNPVFRGVAKQVVAHTMADHHMRRAPGQQPVPAPAADAPEPLYPTATFTHAWSGDAGDERIVARHHGRGHTSGDAVITFERANVVHMGDLMFHQRHPVVDRTAGAFMRNWGRILEQVAGSHARDTVFIFGHAKAGLPVTGGAADLLRFRDYLDAVLAFVDTHVRAGRSRAEILAMREPLAGFEDWGRFGQPGARDPLTVAYEEITTGM